MQGSFFVSFELKLNIERRLNDQEQIKIRILYQYDSSIRVVSNLNDLGVSRIKSILWLWDWNFQRSLNVGQTDQNDLVAVRIDSGTDIIKFDVEEQNWNTLGRIWPAIID